MLSLAKNNRRSSEKPAICVGDDGGPVYDSKGDMNGHTKYPRMSAGIVAGGTGVRGPYFPISFNFWIVSAGAP